MKTQRTLLALTLWLSACAPVTNTAYPPPTQDYPAPATATVAPTAVPTTPAPPTETPAPTATPEPEVWEIWFNGFSCEFLSVCDVGPGQEDYYYSIKSDGTDLRQLSLFMSDFISDTVQIPSGEVPILPGMYFFPTISPSGKQAVYFGEDRGLHILQIASGEAAPLYSANRILLLGPYCWSDDESEITFVEVRRGEVRQTPVVRRIDSTGQNLQTLYSLQGLERMRSGACSPDGRQMALGINSADEGKDAGLFLINLDSGEYRQILANYSVWSVRPAP